MRRITRTAWFGPKRVVGWGWTPTNAAGWLVTFGAMAIVVLSVIVMRDRRAVVVSVLAVAGLILVAAITGDPPGGPRTRRNEAG